AGDMSVRVLRVVGEKLYAAGGSDWRPHMWHSDDQGRSWKRLPNPVHGDLFKDGVDLVDIASDGSSTMALGLEPTVLQLRNDRWQDVTSDEFPNGGVQPFATSVARKGDTTIVAGGRYTAARGDTRERYVGQVWRKTDGAWEPVESEAFEHGHILDVAAYDGGFVAVGFEDFGVASERPIGGDASPDAIIWTSEDGVEWTRVGASQPRIDTDDLTLLPDATEEMAAVIAQMEAEAAPVTDAPAGGDGTHSLSGVAALAQGFAA